MSRPSMLDPFGTGEKSAVASGPHHRQNDAGPDEEQIPTYAESSSQPAIDPEELRQIQQALAESSAVAATAATPSYTSDTAAEPAPGPVESNQADLPDYTILDPNQTTFLIHGTFIHTPAGPVYQLSGPLDTRSTPFRIRRLRPREITQITAPTPTPVVFDKTNVLYEITDPPLLEEYHIFGKRKTCFPGVLELKYLIGNKWRVKQVPRPGAKAKEILTSKRVGISPFSSRKLNRKKEEESSEWKDAQGRVVATEVLRKLGDGGVVPVIELNPDLDQSWRELVLTIWAARLWVAFGKEKTYALGGRLENGSFARLAGTSALEVWGGKGKNVAGSH